MIRKLILSLLLLIVAVQLSSCSNTDSQYPNGQLILYSGRSESLIANLIEQFSEETGIKVLVRYGNTAELAATILEEGENSPADLFFAQDPGGLGAIANQNILAELPDNLLSMVDSRFSSSQKLWVGISGRARVITYNTENVTLEDLPQDMFGFTDSKWKGRIGLPPTNGSFQTMVTGMRKIWGEQVTRTWLEGIMANDPQFYEKNTPTVAAVGVGEIDIGFVNHYYLYRFISEQGEEFPARNYFLPSGGPGSLIMVSAIGRLNTGENEANALKFIEFLLSETAQEYFNTETYEYPLTANMPIQAGIIPLSELNAAEIDLSDLSDLQGTIKLLQDVGMLP